MLFYAKFIYSNIEIYLVFRYRKEQIVEGHTLVQAMVTEPDGTVRVNKEVQHAEKIYATLRECREQSGAKKNKGIKMQGYLEKKSEKNKKWKALYFVLVVDASDTHLYLYDNPKRTKPKGLIDCCAYLYHVRFLPFSVLQENRIIKCRISFSISRFMKVCLTGLIVSN